MERACQLCEWARNRDGDAPADGQQMFCREGPTPQAVPRGHWCGRFRLAERLAGGRDARGQA